MRIAATCIALLAVTSPLIAQRPHAFAELSVGPSRGVGGGPYHTRGSLAVMMAIGTQPHSDRSFMLAAHAGLWGAHGDDLCPATTPSGCLPQFPVGRVLALTAGGRALSGSAVPFEFLAGPAFVSEVEGGGTSTGLFTQLRFGSSPGSYFSPALLFQGIVVRLDGSTLAVGAIGLSVRFW